MREYRLGAGSTVVSRLTKIGSLKQLQEDLDKLAPAWIADKAVSPDAQRRTLAAFALEAAYAHPEQPDAASKLVEWGCRQVRRNPKPDEFDRRWHWAAIAILEGAVDPDALESHLAHMQFQFPNEPRVTLVLGVAEEMRVFSLMTSGRGPAGEIANRNKEAARRFQAAAAGSSAPAEANLRLGHVRIQLGQPEQALEALGRVEPATADQDFIYLARLFRGQALDDLGQADAARDAYRGALQVRPGAQTATTALAALLFRTGRREEAAELATQIVHIGTNVPDDPWWNYWPGDYRDAYRLMTAMREVFQ